MVRAYYSCLWLRLSKPDITALNYIPTSGRAVVRYPSTHTILTPTRSDGGTGGNRLRQGKKRESITHDVPPLDSPSKHLVGVTDLSPAPFQVIKEPYEYICQVRGKEVRLLLINAFDSWLHIPAGKKADIGEITQMLHNASLL